MSLDRVSNSTPLAFESDALPTALRVPAKTLSLFYQVVRRFCQMQIVTFRDNEFAGLQKLFMFLNRYRVVLNKYHRMYVYTYLYISMRYFLILLLLGSFVQNFYIILNTVDRNYMCRVSYNVPCTQRIH